MTKLKLSAIPDDKPVKLTVARPADVHRDLVDYATVLARQTGQKSEPAQLVAPMIARFMATDRGFAKARKAVDAAARQKTTVKMHKPPLDI